MSTDRLCVVRAALCVVVAPDGVRRQEVVVHAALTSAGVDPANQDVPAAASAAGTIPDPQRQVAVAACPGDQLEEDGPIVVVAVVVASCCLDAPAELQAGQLAQQLAVQLGLERDAQYRKKN